MNMGPAEIKNAFGFHPATEDVKPLYADIRDEFLGIAQWLNQVLPHSREKSLAITKLQEAQMFAIGSVAIHMTPLAE